MCYLRVEVPEMTTAATSAATIPARATLPLLVGLLALATPLVGQAKHGSFYHFNYYQVRPGAEKAYDSLLVNVVTPVFDEMVKSKTMVSYLLFTKRDGSGDG